MWGGQGWPLCGGDNLDNSAEVEKPGAEANLKTITLGLKFHTLVIPTNICTSRNAALG